MRRYWPGGDALGRRIKLTKDWLEIVGIARDVKNRNLSEASLLGVALLAGYIPAFSLDSTSVKVPSVVTAKPAIRGHFKTGHRDWPKT
jgi:hypothetical protein